MKAVWQFPVVTIRQGCIKGIHFVNDLYLWDMRVTGLTRGAVCSHWLRCSLLGRGRWLTFTVCYFDSYGAKKATEECERGQKSYFAGTSYRKHLVQKKIWQMKNKSLFWYLFSQIRWDSAWKALNWGEQLSDKSKVTIKRRVSLRRHLGNTLREARPWLTRVRSCLHLKFWHSVFTYSHLHHLFKENNELLTQKNTFFST